MLVDVYKTLKREDTYLYTAMNANLNDILPETLYFLFKDAKKIMRLDLNKREQLARLSVDELKEKLEEQSYYLQMPVNPITGGEIQPEYKINPDFLQNNKD